MMHEYLAMLGASQALRLGAILSRYHFTPMADVASTREALRMRGAYLVRRFDCLRDWSR